MVDSFGDFDEGAQALDFNDNATASAFGMPTDSFDGAVNEESWPTSQFSSQLATPKSTKDEDDFTPEELAQIQAVEQKNQESKSAIYDKQT
jgi:hypothetical protein